MINARQDMHTKFGLGNLNEYILGIHILDDNMETNFE
jgi:hypothetical protein